jgi:hypothetical protein
LGLIDLDLTPIEHEPVELCDRCARSLGGAHGHEGEATGLTRLAVGGHGHLANFSGRGECGLDGLLAGAERQISYVETIAHGSAAFMASC